MHSVNFTNVHFLLLNFLKIGILVKDFLQSGVFIAQGHNNFYFVMLDIFHFMGAILQDSSQRH